MNKINYDLVFENTINEIKSSNKKPKLLLHVCCAPCSTACLTRLFECFEITLYFYNPNVTNEEEYNKRAEELKNFIKVVYDNKIKVIIVEHNKQEFYNEVLGLEDYKEGGERCFKCYSLRLLKTGIFAKQNGYDYFTTTLSVSPYKNSQKLNELGKEISEKLSINYLFSDFKKQEGYKKSVELSNKYNLYRQNYCGCEFSKKEQENKTKGVY